MSWFSRGIELFRKEPLLMILIGITFGIISISTKLIPGIGFLISGFLSNILLVGMMKGCRDLDDGKSLTFEHLFSGFNEDLRGLFALYICELAILTGCVLLFFGLLIALVGFSIVGIMLSSHLSFSHFLEAMEPQTVLIVIMFAILIVFFSIFIATSFVYAPYLLVFKKQKIFESIQNSFKGIMSHMWSLTALGLVHIGVLILSALTLGLGLFIAAPIIFCSFYYSYKDIFAPAFVNGTLPENEQNQTRPLV